MLEYMYIFVTTVVVLSKASECGMHVPVQAS